MKPKSLEECKNIVAKRHGHNSWKDFMDYAMEEQRFMIISEYSDEAAELYARSVWDEACEAQKNSISLWLQEHPEYHGDSLIWNEIHVAPKPEYNPL